MTVLTAQEKFFLQHTHRIPVDSSYPGIYWIVNLDYESEMPTSQEIEQIKSYTEYKVRTVYNEGYQRRILEMPLPACSGHNTIILSKNPEGRNGWFYRRTSWTSGPRYFPRRDAQPPKEYSLLEIFERCETITEKVSEAWTKWKHDHPEVFPQ